MRIKDEIFCFALNRGGYRGYLRTTQNIECPSIMTPSKMGKTQNFIFYSLIDEYTASLKLKPFLVFLLQIIKQSQLAVSNLPYLENGKMNKIGHSAVCLDGDRHPGYPCHVWICHPTFLPCCTKGYPLQVWPPCPGGLVWVLSPWDQGSGWPHDAWILSIFPI